MTFTKTPPTKPGAYWHRWGAKHPDGKVLVEVEIDAQTGLLIDESSHLPPKEVGGEWSGPLVPVEEVEKAYYEGSTHSQNLTSYANSRARRVVEGEIQ